MKICFVAPRYHTNQHFWVKALQEAGDEVAFLVSYKAEVAEHYEFLTPTVAGTATFGSKVVPSLKWLKNYFSTEQPDVVIIRDASNLLSLATFLVCKRLRIKTILYSQHPLEEKPKLHIRLLQAFGIVPYTRITPIRKNKELTEYGPAHYVPLITDFVYNISSRTYDDQSLRILFVGKFDLPRKNHLLMLEALLTTRRAGRDIHLTMLGWSNKTEPLWHEVQEYLDEHQLHDAVTIRNNVAFAGMPAIYQEQDLFVLPSTNEPFSITPLEAMSFGVPAVITHQNGAQYCLTDNEDGVIIAANDQAALTSVLCRLDTDRNQLQKLSQNAYTTIKQQHTPTTFLTLLHNALNQN